MPHRLLPELVGEIILVRQSGKDAQDILICGNVVEQNCTVEEQTLKLGRSFFSSDKGLTWQRQSGLIIRLNEKSNLEVENPSQELYLAYVTNPLSAAFYGSKAWTEKSAE